MFRAAGMIRHSCRLTYFNFLPSRRRDAWGRGRFEERVIPKPESLKDIRRRFRRFGRPRSEFREFLKTQAFDAVLIQTSMTYWFQGVREVVEDVRELQPSAKITLGGVYATLCPDHARDSGADLVIERADLGPLRDMLSIDAENGIPYFPPDEAGAGIMKITEGCPFRCTYCAASLFWPGFAGRPLADCLAELRHMVAQGVRNIAFYDDALLFNPEQALIPFLEEVIRSDIRVAFHTPNALNARFVNPELARLMVRAGFASFYFGLESSATLWQSSSGGKVYPGEFADAARHLREAGAESVTAYVLIGHPDLESGDVESSIRFAHQCGSRVLLSEFSPIPGTVDGEKSRPWADLADPYSHNKTAFTIRRLGDGSVNKLKTLTHSLNSRLANS